MPRVASSPTEEDPDRPSMLNPLEDLFGVLDAGIRHGTEGDFVHPTFRRARAVWADLSSKLGVDPGVLSGGLGDDDCDSEFPTSDGIFSRTCPHIRAELQHPETTWRAYGGGPSTGGANSLQCGKLHPALLNCFCSHHCTECPPPSDVVAALNAAAKNKGRGNQSSSAAGHARDRTSAAKDPGGIPVFHGHCVGCLGEFLVNKQYEYEGSS